jgi:hypothetical protein
LTVAVLLALSTTADAQQQQDKRKQKPRQVPDTGVEEVVPATPATEAVEALFEEMTSRSSEGLVEVEHADGTVSMDLQGRFMSVMMVAPGAGGEQRILCVTGDEMLRLARSKQSAVPPASQMPQRSTPAPTTSAAREIK